MGDILFLSQRIPYPPDKGDKIRSWRALLHLAEHHRVHLGTFIDDPDDLRHTSVMETLCESTCIVPLHPLLARVKSIKAFLTGEPLSVPYFYDAALASWIKDTLAERQIDAIFVYSSTMAQYVLKLSQRPKHFLMDFVDVDSEKFRQYAAERGLLSRLVYGREGTTLLAFERHVAREADAAFFVSEPEAELFRSLAPESAAKAFSLSNGIDTDYFNPAVVMAGKSDLPEFGAGPNIVFTGRMDYKPNVDAVCWFADEVLPGLLEDDIETRFVIAGAAPAPDVTALATRPAIRVTGRVEDMRPFLAHADVAVAPMAIGRGIQNKVLEAAAMARPVVTTPQGLEGIALSPGKHLLVAEGPDTFLKTILDTLKDPDTGGHDGQGSPRPPDRALRLAGRMALLDEFLT